VYPNVLEMIIEARSSHNDGWTKKLYLKRLEGIEDPETKKTVESILRREKKKNGNRI